MRGFDFDKFIQSLLAQCGLSKTALLAMDADKNNFDDLQRARKSYVRLSDELKAYRQKIIRHGDRLLKYLMMLTKNAARFDDDEWYFSVAKPQSKRLAALSDDYTAIAKKLLKAEHTIDDDIVYNIEQYQQGYFMRTFAIRLRQARRKAGLTQAELAEKLGLKRSSYTAIETARNEPNISVLALVSLEFNLPTNWFLGL